MIDTAYRFWRPSEAQRSPAGGSGIGYRVGMPSPDRLPSIDALRGFDMMMILGGREVLLGVVALFGSERLNAWLLGQTVHPEWHGFTPWDLIFPLSLFLAGAALPFSFAARQARGDSRRALAVHTLRRATILVALGAVYNGVLGLDLEQARLASVLGRIGLAWAGAALIVLLCGLRVQVLLFGRVLAAHTVLLMLVPMPGLEEVSLEPGLTVTDWIDRHVTPGKLLHGDRDPEAVMGTLPAIGTALLGSFVGRWMRREGLSRSQRFGGLVLMGLQCLAGAKLLEVIGLPINKNLWTASFALWAGGWSVLLLALFHLAFDVVGWSRLAQVFAVIGANAILAYMASAFIDFQGLVQVVFARGFAWG